MVSILNSLTLHYNLITAVYVYVVGLNILLGKRVYSGCATGYSSGAVVTAIWS